MCDVNHHMKHFTICSMSLSATLLHLPRTHQHCDLKDLVLFHHTNSTHVVTYRLAVCSKFAYTALSMGCRSVRWCVCVRHLSVGFQSVRIFGWTLFYMGAARVFTTCNSIGRRFCSGRSKEVPAQSDAQRLRDEHLRRGVTRDGTTQHADVK